MKKNIIIKLKRLIYILYYLPRREASRVFSQNLRNNKEKLVEPERGYIKKNFLARIGLMFSCYKCLLSATSSQQTSNSFIFLFLISDSCQTVSWPLLIMWQLCKGLQFKKIFREKKTLWSSAFYVIFSPTCYHLKYVGDSRFCTNNSSIWNEVFMNWEKQEKTLTWYHQSILPKHFYFYLCS